MEKEKLVELFKARFIENDDVEVEEVNRYAEGRIEIILDDGSEYLILDEESQYEYARDNIESSISYFVPRFLSKATGLNEIVFEKLVDENEAVLKIVEATCGIDSFVEEAVRVDGMGRFIAMYDGEETWLEDDYSVFRMN